MSKDTFNQPLIWIDLETTGLDPDEEKILEIATIITDPDLNTIAEGPNIVIHQPDSVLAEMGEWCTDQHGKTGLTQAVRESKVNLIEAESETFKFIERYCETGKSPLCGNTIDFDRSFLRRHMSGLEASMAYRSVNVSSFKIMIQGWYPEIEWKKDGLSLWANAEAGHRALEDIRESINELRFYRNHMFRHKKDVAMFLPMEGA